MGGTPPAFIFYAYVSGPPISVLVIIIGLMACAPLENIVPWLCPGSEIFLAPPLHGCCASTSVKRLLQPIAAE